MGYGVVRQSIGDDMNKVMYLGLGYTVLSSIYTLVSALPNRGRYLGDPTYENLFSLVTMLLATIDTTFYMWTISSLNSILVTLRARKQTAKLALYLKFRAILVASVACAVFWAIYGAYLVGGDVAERNWDQRWTIDASSETIYFVIFLSIAILWAPYRNNQRYVSYVELTRTEGGADDDQAPSSPGGREAGPQYEEDDIMDAEYGGALDDDDNMDPFRGTGALDPAMAIMKKN
jgi:hypothetical protein